jgi:RNA polymerase sigma-70 factor (ECF subfamily)
MAAAGPTFEQLVSEHRGRVYRLCRSILRDDDLGKDAAQETFLKLWRALSAGEAPDRPDRPDRIGHFGAWLRRVAVSTSLDLARRREVRSRAEDTAGERPLAAPDPAAGASLAELEERLERTLVHLSEGQRTVFLLRHDGGLSLREVAEATGVELSTARTQFARACLKLQAHLSSYDPSETT